MTHTLRETLNIIDQSNRSGQPRQRAAGGDHRQRVGLSERWLVIENGAIVEPRRHRNEESVAANLTRPPRKLIDYDEVRGGETQGRDDRKVKTIGRPQGSRRFEKIAANAPSPSRGRPRSSRRRGPERRSSMCQGDVQLNMILSVFNCHSIRK